MSDLATLRAEIDTLRERIAQMEAALRAGDAQCPPDWRLTWTESRIMGLMARREVATKESLLAALYDSRGVERADPHAIAAHICKMRHKLAPHAVNIETFKGVGWRLDPATRAMLRQRRSA